MGESLIGTFMTFLPVNLSIEDRLCLVIGGGRVAVRKVQTLLQAGAKVRVISPDLDPRLQKLATAGRIQWKPRRFKKCDLKPAWLVIAAAADRDLNRQIQTEAKRRRLWVNAVDDPENSSVIFPSFLCRGGLVVAISTSGQSPALSRKIRESLEHQWNPKTGTCLEWIGRFREQVKAKISNPRQRFRFWDQALTPKVIKLIRQGKIAELKRSLKTQFKKFPGAK